MFWPTGEFVLVSSCASMVLMGGAKQRIAQQ
jgi:hypothetical protein